MELQKIIKSRLKKIEDAKLYSPKEILELGVVLKIKFEPSLDRVYRLIKRGLLPTKNFGDLQARWFVTGKDLRAFAEARYLSKK